jgi:hypothetical protein
MPMKAAEGGAAYQRERLVRDTPGFLAAPFRMSIGNGRPQEARSPVARAHRSVTGTQEERLLVPEALDAVTAK